MDWPGPPVAPSRARNPAPLSSTPLRDQGRVIRRPFVVYRRCCGRSNRQADRSYSRTSPTQAVIAIENTRLLSELRKRWSSRRRPGRCSRSFHRSPGDWRRCSTRCWRMQRASARPDSESLWLDDGVAFARSASRCIPGSLRVRGKDFLFPFDSDRPFDRRQNQTARFTLLTSGTQRYSHGFKPFVELATRRRPPASRADAEGRQI